MENKITYHEQNDIDNVLKLREVLKTLPPFCRDYFRAIDAGGTHHSCFSYDLTAEYWEDYAEIAGIEMIRIDKDTTISNFKKELRMNEVYYMLNKALC